jgi:hypothetical protein
MVWLFGAIVGLISSFFVKAPYDLAKAWFLHSKWGKSLKKWAGESGDRAHKKLGMTILLAIIKGSQDLMSRLLLLMLQGLIICTLLYGVIFILQQQKISWVETTQSEINRINLGMTPREITALVNKENKTENEKRQLIAVSVAMQESAVLVEAMQNEGRRIEGFTKYSRKIGIWIMMFVVFAGGPFLLYLGFVALKQLQVAYGLSIWFDRYNRTVEKIASEKEMEELARSEMKVEVLGNLEEYLVKLLQLSVTHKLPLEPSVVAWLDYELKKAVAKGL